MATSSKCTTCRKPLTADTSVFQGSLVCQKCYDDESQRSRHDDAAGGGMRSRPPKYMLDPKDYKKFGY